MLTSAAQLGDLSDTLALVDGSDFHIHTECGTQATQRIDSLLQCGWHWYCATCHIGIHPLYRVDGLPVVMDTDGHYLIK